VVKLSKTKLFWLFLLLGLVIRLLLLPGQYAGDINNHLAWADRFLTGQKDFYQSVPVGITPPNYPPLSIFLFSLSRLIYFGIYKAAFVVNQNLSLFPSFVIPFLETQNAQAAFMKIFPVIADLGVAFLLFKITRSSFLAILYLLNPAVIYISSVWGQIESIPIFFILLSFYLLTLSKNSKQSRWRIYYLSHLAFCLAYLSKQTSLWLLPIFAIAWIKEGGIGRFLSGVLFQLLLFWLFFLPFTTNLVGQFTIYINTLSGSSRFVTDAAWNIWWLYSRGQKIFDDVRVGIMSARNLSLLLVSIGYAGVTLWLFRKYRFSKVVFGLLCLSLIAFFLQTRVHERHLAPVLPLILISSIGLRLKLVLFVIFTLFHFLNLYASLGLPFW